MQFVQNPEEVDYLLLAGIGLGHAWKLLVECKWQVDAVRITHALYVS